ncbi:MAG TPA: hypothetical protein PLZ55_07060 [bacterium]|nr:hypothetical protein [bacterium]HQQ01309.1 hypothetical protein [bacterium]
MPGDWTIDTNVLYKAAEVDLPAVTFLLRILEKKEPVNMDHERRILKEYQNCLCESEKDRLGGIGVLKKWFKVIIDKHVQLRSGRLSRKQENSLRKMGFHRDDWPFVGVCARSDSRRLVTEDSDYTPEVRNYLGNEMSIRILAVSETQNE